MAIVLSYHGNEESEAALRLAVQLAKIQMTTLVVVLARKESASDVRTSDDVEDRLFQDLGRGDVAFQVRFTRVDQQAADAVLEVAAELSADFIVLGIRPGGSGVTSIGANASRILLDAPCPVVTTTTHE